jgi:ribosomal protein S18 acetylase RimI-like enzyme
MIESLDAAGAARARSGLVALLRDAVDGGASLGFLPPLGEAEAAAYWDGVVAALRDGSRVLLVARDQAAGIVGSAQLELAMQANAHHRAEVSKVMVHRTARRRGIGRALMLVLESEARGLGRTTLVLDTRQGDPSESLYRALGWREAGTIPRYAESADGSLHATVIYYRLVGPP